MEKKSIWSRLLHSPFSFVGMYALASVAIEWLLRAFTTGRTMPFFSGELALLSVFTAFLAVLWAGIAFLFPQKRVRQILLIVFLGLNMVFAMSQMIYYHMMGQYYQLYSVSHAGQVAEFSGGILQQIWIDLLCLLAMAAPFAGICVAVFWLKSVTEPQPLFVKLLTIGISVVLYIIGLVAVLFGSPTTNDLYWHAPDAIGSIRAFGTPTALRLEVRFMIFGTSNGGWDPDTPNDIPTEPTTPSSSTEDDPVTPIEPTYNVMDIDFDALIAASKNENITSLHQYFSSLSPTKTNAYTGMFKGKNLITITAESFDPAAVRQDLTPTLYKMTHEGLEFTNFYCPAWGVSTLDGEYVNTLGTIPKGGVWSMYRARNNNLYFALGNTANRAGYQTWAFHNYVNYYYDRDQSHPNLGYKFLALEGGLEIPSDYMWPPSDYDLMDVTPSYYLTDLSKPFCIYYLSVSGHAPYSFVGNMMSYLNKDAVQNLPYDDQGRAYIACQIEFERGMKLLLDKLEEAGVLNDTLIVISPDHYPYAMSDETIATLRGTPVDSNFERYHSTLVMYNPQFEHKVIDKPCYAVDILPTVLNLMGFEYDSRILIGRDILSDSEGLVIFQNRSWITSRGRYNSLTKTFTPNPGVTVDEDYVSQVNTVVYKKFNASVSILDDDYYASIFGENTVQHIP